MKYKLNWRPSLPDFRDYKFTRSAEELPPVVSMSHEYKKVFDQGELGSCTANAASGLVGFQHVKEKQAVRYHASRLFIYYNERVIERTVKQDSGAEVRDAIKTLSKQGACKEADWNYEQNFTAKPPQACYDKALNFKIKEYLSIDNANINDVKSCLAQGYGIIFGFSVYESFQSKQVEKTGVVSMPSEGEQLLGGHCTWMHGYNDETKLFSCRNSWGAKWGDKGDFYLPYDYVTNYDLAQDFWSIKLV